MVAMMVGLLLVFAAPPRAAAQSMPSFALRAPREHR